MNTRKSAVAVAALLALAVPTASSAAPGKGKSGEAKAKVETKAKGHAKAKNAVFKGAVVSADGTTVTVHVDKANKWGRSFKDTDVVFDVSGLKKAAVVVAGDRVLVQARITKDAAGTLKARKLNKLEADEVEETEAPAPVEAPAA